jgi:natural product precursor
MRKIKLNTSKLKLTKEKIANLTNDEMKAVYGGDDGSVNWVCPSMPATACQTNPPVSGYSPCAVSAFGTCTLAPSTTPPPYSGGPGLICSTMPETCPLF